MKQKITVFGSFVVDLMARTPHLPAPGETVKGSFFKQGAGGKGFNQGIAAHKTGADVAMITKLGRDSPAGVATDAMDAVGMPKDYLFFNDTAPTGVALIMVDENSSQNEIVIVPGACATITDADIASVEKRIKESAYVLLQLEVNQDANEKVARLAKETGVRVIVNPAPYQPVTDAFLNGCYLVTPNEVEAEELTGVPVDSVCSEGKSEIIPAFKVNAIDTTGAGDAFNGGLLTALAEGKNLHDAACFANAVAAISVQRIGTTPSMPTREEVDAFLREH